MILILDLEDTGIQGISADNGLGWVDLDLGSSPGWWATILATYCANLSQPNQGPRPAGTPCTLVDNLTH